MTTQRTETKEAAGMRKNVQPTVHLPVKETNTLFDTHPQKNMLECYS
jgi:hypothetical protein